MLLKVKDVKKQFGSKEVLKGATLTFEKGKIYGLLGRNGVGKTTLFNLLHGDLDVDEGKFILKTDEKEREICREDIGYVASIPNVPAFLTGREFLKFFLDIHREKIQDCKTIDEYFDFIAIAEEDRDKLLKDYSHGMKSKMQMLLQMILRPPVLLFDEPLTSLDVVVAEEMKKTFQKIKKDNILIVSTHIMDLALNLCDEIVLLSHGTLFLMDKEGMNNEQLRKKIMNVLKKEDTYVE